ncbi:MAG: aspartate aminotransferase family protein [Acidisphaera sp.]|nr:aspartate aminotransferase family protein [Acidisphaera sp.]
MNAPPNVVDATNSPIVAAYVARTPRSAQAYEAARRLLPGGVTHDVRYIRPHPIYVEHAGGARKRDIDGHEYVDYQGGHGALILGHAHPEVVAKVAEQLARGTHYGANHELETRWAGLICDMVPSAELVRFTSSGTEATMMALRLSRAATGRQLFLRFRGHFHGWHDHVAFGVVNHFDGTPTPGVIPELAENVVLVTPNDVDGLRAAFAEHGHAIAAAIIEPTGSNYGQVPLADDFIRVLREETKRHGAVLIFDEVVTGFRVSRGGAQAALGITPDLTTLAKIMAGGLPGGAVAGRRDLLELLDPERAEARGIEKIGHQGTYNANPLSATAGIATLELIRDTDALERTHAYAARLREGARQVLVEEGVAWGAYGTHTGLHLFVNPNGLAIDPASFDPMAVGFAGLKIPRGNQVGLKLRLAMRVNGVDLAAWPGGPCSAAHDETDLDRTLTALRGSIRMLREEREIA